ncbi:hypothetical protein N7461_003795 [Penicillium sp. DV-2018c]|nr:hypothetical protein N7461_003795 [Penicillium sp. DV-2018c]
MANRPPASHVAETKSAAIMRYLNANLNETTNPDASNAGEEISPVHTAPRTQPLLAGYFGPTSFVSPLTEDVDLAAGDQGLGLDTVSVQRVLPPYWVHKISEVLLTLSDFTTAETLIREFYAVSQGAIIAAPFVLNSLNPVKEMCRDSISDHNFDNFTSSVTVRIIQNTSELFQVPPTMKGRDFHALFTGPAIRLEIIGLLCALAGRARYLGVAGYKSNGSLTPRYEYARKMLAASDAALHICKIITPLNDLTIWLVQENLLLTDLVNGDSSPSCWNRLGELSTDIFALGLHRDIKTSNDLPEFLLESRRRQFAAAYQLDKSIATFLGRPPRIPWRYADCRMPLDISDEALATDGMTLNYSPNDIDENGWSVHGVVQRSSWIRVRFIISTFRDEILEVSLQSVTPQLETMLEDISRRCYIAWESLPRCLRYSPECWDRNLPVAVCLMMIVSYLAYLYNDFLIQRLLAGKNNPRGNTALISVSARILSTVLKLGTQREQMVDLRPDFTWTVLLYGFPSASLLIKALQHQKRTGEPFLYDESRSALIRNLSVFISHLESIVRPDNANYALFQRASQVFSKIIDEVLEPQSVPESDLGNTSLLDFDPMIEGDGLDLFNNMDFGVAFNQWLF